MDVVLPEIGRRKRRKQRLTWIVVIATATVIVISITSFGATTPKIDRNDVLIGIVHRGEFIRAVRGPGRLVPSETRWVVARTDATVERILVRPGMTVKSDTVILELSNPDVQNRLLVAESAYVAAKADHSALQAEASANLLEIESLLAEVRGQFMSAEVEEEASRLGYEKGVISAVRYKQTLIEMQQLSQRVRIEEQRAAKSRLGSRAQVVANQSRLDQLARTRDLRKLEAEALKVKSGLEGVMQQISVEEGQRVSAGVNLARAARPSTLIAELRIAESQASDLHAEQPAVIDVGQSRIDGKVRRISPIVEGGTILVEVQLRGALPASARAGQSVDGSIITGRESDALFLDRPINSAPRSEGTVFRVTAEGAAQRVSVRFGKDSVRQIEVLSGLKEGDRVIVSDMSDYDQAGEVFVD